MEDQRHRVSGQVGDRSVLLLASGGVDSTVAAAVIGQALGSERLHLLHVDNGLMRKDESRQVLERFKELGLDDNLHFVDASDTFLKALATALEPEAKRRIIGDTFIRVFQDKARALGVEDHLLGQGTIYPDTIETDATKRSDIIKTYHNRVPVIEEMIARGTVVEPLAELYEVEVRELGERLGMPHGALWRHPFPRPGLGVRLLCSDGVPDLEGLEDADDAVPEAANRFGLEAIVLPIRSVGVKTDLRAYEHPVLLSGDVGWSTLLNAASMLTAEIPGINRCIWNLGAEAPDAARPVAATVTRERLDVLREADHIVMEALRRHDLYDEIWQCPTVLLPVEVGRRDGGGAAHPVKESHDGLSCGAPPCGTGRTASADPGSAGCLQPGLGHHPQAPRHHRVGVSA